MNITIRPLGRGRFAASVGQRLLCQCRTPFFTAARTLQSEGIPDDTVISMTHERSNVVAMWSTVGKAAGLTVLENDSDGLRFAPHQGLPLELHVSCPSGSATAGIMPIQVEL